MPASLESAHLYLFIGDSPFFWVRASTLKSIEARRRGIGASVAFESGYPGGSCYPLFNRFCYGRFYRLLIKTFIRRGVPYLADIDDLYWELPHYSNDQAGRDRAYTDYLDFLLANAWGIVCSTEYLRDRIAARFPKSRTFLVENCPPGWFAPPGSLVIANTDSVKFSSVEIDWFAPLLRRFWDDGVGIQLIGENDSLEGGVLGLRVHSLPRLGYRDYLSHLSTKSYRLGVVPVDDSSYASAKSSIKIQEFVSHGIPVVASDIEPHRRFLAEYQGLPVTLVPNTQAAWAAGLQPYLENLSENERSAGRRMNAALFAARERQLNQWEDVLRSLPVVERLAEKNRTVCRLLRAHHAYDRLKTFLFKQGGKSHGAP